MSVIATSKELKNNAVFSLKQCCVHCYVVLSNHLTFNCRISTAHCDCGICCGKFVFNTVSLHCS